MAGSSLRIVGQFKKMEGPAAANRAVRRATGCSAPHDADGGREAEHGRRADHESVDDPTLRWVSAAELTDKSPLDVAGCGVTAAIPEDVRQLALIAIESVPQA